MRTITADGSIAKYRFDLEDRLVAFASLIVDVIEMLPDTKIANHIAGQLLRSGTSAGPNYGEAESAESRRDFIHKMKVALKELRETIIWLKIIKRRSLIRETVLLDTTVTENNELIAIFVSSIATAQRNDGQSRNGNTEYRTRNTE